MRKAQKAGYHISSEVTPLVHGTAGIQTQWFSYQASATHTALPLLPLVMSLWQST